VSRPRHRPLIFAGAALALVWIIAAAALLYARHSKVTAEKVREYLHEVKIAELQGDARAEALSRLAQQINQLPAEERRQARRDPEWATWFAAMTDQEKLGFIDATLPSGVKQMIEAFEKLPEDQRRRAVSDAVRRLREAELEDGGPPARSPDGMPGPPPGLPPQAQQQIIQHGLRAFFAESSAQTKAEVAPFLEELQRAMESGRVFRGR
jgi:hypothetical protein